VPDFSYDISDLAVEYVKASIKDMPGNPGQEVLVEALDYDCSAEITVYIAGDVVETSAEGSIRLNSNHPEAIEQIIAAGEDNFDELITRLSKESFNAYQGLDLIETIRQNNIDQAFGDLE
jgi:hypothetical protein